MIMMPIAYVQPGQLQGVSEIISRCGGNVVSVYHDRADTSMTITSCYLRLGLEDFCGGLGN